MAPRSRALALLCCLAAAMLAGGSGAAAAKPTAHERACGTAFGVLQRCAAAMDQRASVKERCCGLLAIFQRNGCLW